MNRSTLPDAAFVDPGGENAEAVRNLAESVLDRLLDQLTTAEGRSPLPPDPTVPTPEIPDRPREADAILDDLDDVVAGSMNPAHSGYIGHVTSSPAVRGGVSHTVGSQLAGFSPVSS